MSDFNSKIEEILADLQGKSLQTFSWGSITTYTFWILITLLVVFAAVWLLRSRISFIPRRGPVAALEAVVDYIRREIGENILGSSARQHLPFLLTLFFFILAANLIGLVPGAKAASGTMSATVALAICSFGYFTWAGIRHSGLGRYIVSLAPAGLPPGLNVLVWLIELFSQLLRIATLSIRLFANMFAGHLVLGCFAALTSIYILPLIQQFTLANLGGGLASIGWIAMLTAVYALETMVAFIQAYVFTLLSGVYIQLATSSH